MINVNPEIKENASQKVDDDDSLIEAIEKCEDSIKKKVENKGQSEFSFIVDLGKKKTNSNEVNMTDATRYEYLKDEYFSDNPNAII